MEEFFEEQIIEEEGVDVGQYFKALVCRWWLIVLIFLGVIIPWMLYLKHQPPVYEADAWIIFHDVAGGGVPETVVQSRTMKLKSRSLTEGVTAELGLTLQLLQEENEPFLERDSVFKTFSTSKEPVPGSYKLLFYPSGYCAFYFESERLDSLRVRELVNDTVSYNGMNFSLTPDIVKNRSEVAFVIRNFHGTVSSLVSRVNIRTNREGNMMRIILKDRDPVLAAQTINLLAGIFIQKSLEMGKENQRFMRDYIKEQLDLVQQELNKSDSQLQSFREEYLVGLDEETRQTVTRLTALERDISRLTLHKNELDLLLGKLNPRTSDFDEGVSMRYVYRQIALQPVFMENADMTIAKLELNDLDREKGELLVNLPETNPNVMELSERMQMLEEKIYRLAKNKMKELDGQISQMSERMKELQRKLDTLPEEELRQIKFARERRTNEDLYGLLLKRYKEAQISEAVASEHVSILDPSMPPDRPVSGGKKKKIFLGVFIGLFLGIGAVLIWEETDKSIRTREDVKRHLKLPILGIIPKVKFDNYELQDSEKAKSISSQIVTHDYSPTPVGEAYRSLRTSILFSKSIGPIRSLVIGSVSPGDGKSFTAANLAIALAQQKSKTIIIDADLRRGVLHNSFNCPKKPGLTNYLTGVVPLETVLNETYIPNLSLITCGSLIPNPSELLGSVRMKRFIEGITNRFDFIIFDTPPLIAATDAVILGTFVDGIAILVRAGKSNREDLKRKLELFRNVEARVLGVILNGVGVEVAHEGYSYYRY